MIRLSIVHLTLLACFLACKGPVKKDLPSFDFLMIDQKTLFNTDKIPEGHPFVIVYFSPDCEHCQEETVSILSNIEKLKSIRFYFLTDDPFDRLLVFNDFYKIYDQPNIVLGRDIEYAFQKYYKPDATPFVILYNEKKEVRAMFSGGASPDELISICETM